MRFGKRRDAHAPEFEESTLLVRTWFGNEEAWDALLAVVHTPSADGFLATVSVVDDQVHSDAQLRTLTALLPRHDEYSLVLAADERAMTEPEKPLLAILADGTQPPRTLRIVGSELWGIENNLRLANMEWDSFADAAEADGIFRGFDN